MNTNFKIKNWKDLLCLAFARKQCNTVNDIDTLATLICNAISNAKPGISKEELNGIISAVLISELNKRQSHEPKNLLEAKPKGKTAEDELRKPKSKGVMYELANYMNMRYAFRYNVMTKETEMRRTGGDDNYIVIGKREENTLVIEAQYEGINCWDADVRRLLSSTNTAEYHPFVDYFNNLPEWDGKDRVEELAQRVSDKDVWVDGFHRWMLALSAQWMNLQPETQRANCIAPLLISTEQGFGKSTFCRELMPMPLRRYYTESFNLAEQESCERKLADFGLINLDEFDSLPTRKMPLLKHLMQDQSLNIKKAYEKNASPLHRIASFIGTSNSRELLTDRTGSRRFICVELEKEIDCDTPIDHSQLYAQLKAELLQGARTYFTKDEERRIQENNRPFYQTSAAEEAFYRHFRFAERTEKEAEFMTASEIFKRLYKEEKSVLKGTTAAKFSHLLPMLGNKVHTKLGNGYYVVPILR